MQVYRLKADGFKFLPMVPMDINDVSRFEEFNTGARLAASWTPVRVRFYREGTSAGLAVGDFASFGNSSVPIWSKRAADHLHSHLESHGEILPLSCDEGEYFAFNLTTMRDALDKERSVINRLPSGAVLDMDNKYFFRPSAIEGALLFRIPELNSIFVTDEFVRLVDQERLTGFLFRRPVWSSDPQ